MRTIKSTIKEIFYISPRNKRFLKRQMIHIMDYYIKDILQIIAGVFILGMILISSYILLLLIFD